MYLKPKRKVLSLIFFARTNIYQKQTCKFPLLFSLLIQIKWTNLKVTICALYLFLSYLALSANISAWISFSFFCRKWIFNSRKKNANVNRNENGNDPVRYKTLSRRNFWQQLFHSKITTLPTQFDSKNKMHGLCLFYPYTCWMLFLVCVTIVRCLQKDWQTIAHILFDCWFDSYS